MEFCHSVGTKLMFASVYHPQSNGVVERANRIIFTAIKKCLFDQKKGKWADELPKVIWSHNTAECRATKFTPFRLLYGAEVMTPEELKHRKVAMQQHRTFDGIRPNGTGHFASFAEPFQASRGNKKVERQKGRRQVH